MIRIQLTIDQRATLRNALLDRYQDAAGLQDMLLKLDQKYQQISKDAWTLPENVGLVISTAQAQGWLMPLVRQVRADTPGDPALQNLEHELLPHLPPQHVDYFEVCCMAASRVMVDREYLRASLRLLSMPLGKRIMIVTGGKCSGKSHSFRLISYLSEVRGDFSLIPIDLETYSRMLGANTVVEASDLARALAKKLHYEVGPLEPPNDRQWARWVIDFCDALEAHALDDDRSRWVVIDGFDSVVLAQATCDLIKELAVRIDRSLARFRLILLGYDDVSFPRDVLPQIEREHIRPIGLQELAEFFARAYQQLGIPPDEDRLVASLHRVLDGLNEGQEDFLIHLEPRVSAELTSAAGAGLARTAGQGGGP
jgi:hypothetical protein